MEVTNDLSGAVLDGRYKVIEPVAEGAMGVVYRAERVKLGKIVAVKVLHDELPDELSSRKRFEIEAMAMAKLEHPHCAAVLDVGTHEGKPFVVMDFVTGKDLKSLIADDGPLSVARSIEILRQVLSGLAHAHELGIIHRDVKPANIILSHKAGLGDHVKILDFGLARLQAEQTSKLTTGIVVGTPAYMSPEQVRGGAIDARADLYACGILLMELVTGKKPFHSAKDDPIEVVSMHLKKPPPRLAELMPGHDFGPLEDIVAKALAKSADDRYQSATEFVSALEAWNRRVSPTAATEPAGQTITDSQANQISESMMIPQGGTKLGLVAVPGAGVPGAGVPGPGAMPGVHSGPIPVGNVPSGPHGGPAQPDPRGFEVASLPGARGVDGMPVTRKQLLIGGGAILGLVVIIAVAASGGGTSTPAPPPGPASAAVVKPDSEIEMDPVGSDGADKMLARARDAAASGRREEAIKLLASGRVAFPDNAEIPYEAGKLYFAKLWWTDGIENFKAAVELDATYKSDPELLKLLIKGLITTPSYNSELGNFLVKGIGEPARSYLEQTASDHPKPQVRARAKSVLDRL